ncbi:hypothetical protein ABZS66_61695 [Dactylosporangium sp. NPDC005572]|uniref:hypothetical protein n=1 Tax=Dactylosporangium sp. NPDC005572 TaxID=3156889 RepID=UPI0033A98FB7
MADFDDLSTLVADGALRRDGRPVDDEVLARISPTHHENVLFYGHLLRRYRRRTRPVRRRRLPAAAPAGIHPDGLSQQ